MKLPLTRILLLFFLGFFFNAHCQETNFRSQSVKVSFSRNAPSIVKMLSPQEFVDKSGVRGFKKVMETNEKLTLIGTVSDDDGIRVVLVNDRPVTLENGGYFRMDVQLVDGMKEIVIHVIDVKNNSFEKRLKVRTRGSLGTGKYYALLIGINEYDDPEITDLEKPVQDTRELGEVLTNNYTFLDENVVYLENPTRTEMVDALDELDTRITIEDNLLIFYAGHGYWDKEKQLGYWIPSDGDDESSANWFRNSTLTEQIRTINSRHTLLIADACFSGSIFKSRSLSIAEETKAIEKLYKTPSRKAITSGALEEVPDKSEFIKYLVKNLKSNQSTYLPSADLFSSFRIGVINNGDIIPQYGTIQKAGDEGGDFIFIRKE